ncbi:DoxX-like family protein [Lentzea waywayandensis]|uniref:DoxX-like family protein n=1 Tax=Lentzea waywayandensis TaxID=84724 RepID=A0A1I6DGB6_9PSEU|nr:DoxX family protein [Lentzea waywayandensis]SFR04520.1 DoxX-like family protein [Lentzea waywayandensis]
MNIALWVVQGLLAALYLGAGVMKLARPREQMIASGNFDWAKDVTDNGLKGIGAVEVLGALGLILPWLTGIAPILTPIAAVGLVIVQVFAARAHIKIGDTKSLPVNVILLLLAAFVAVGRFAG